MFKWLSKQLAYGRIYLWAKERLSGILLTLILLILVFYIHSEYLNYIEFKSKNLGSYIGLSTYYFLSLERNFIVIKNILILAIVFGYLYFYRTINKTKNQLNLQRKLSKKRKNLMIKKRLNHLMNF